MIASFHADEALDLVHKEILRLAHERHLVGESLTFAEVLVRIFGCRPEKIGLVSVQGSTLKDLLDVCREIPNEDFHFRRQSEQAGYGVNTMILLTVADELKEKGFIKIETQEKLLW